MERRALLIFGAGASHDVLSTPVGTVNYQYRPPLTKGIFAGTDLVAKVLDRFPLARAMAATVAIELQKGRDLESVLAELSASIAFPRRSQFRQVPLFLQELFGLVSENYVTEPVNYTHLINELLSSFGRVGIVTLNYDLLLEQALAIPGLGGPIVNTDSYIRERWLLIKLHGSVNWARVVRVPYPVSLDPTAGEEVRHMTYLAAILRTGDQFTLRPDIHIVSYRDRWMGSEPLYPVLSVPLGSYEHVCPESHVTALQDFMTTCPNVLIVGISGKDDDLKKLLATSLPSPTVTVCHVDEGRDALDASWAELASVVPQLREAARHHEYSQGFSSFIIGDGLQRFIEDAV